MKDDLRYTPSDCFETFPFPPGWTSDPTLEAVGRAYYEHRAALMVRNNEGLTKTYNRFHDPYERDPGIERLRELHAEMDRAVLRRMAGTTSRPSASSCSTTRSTRRSGGTSGSRTATDGPTMFAMRCSLVSLRSMESGRRRSGGVVRQSRSGAVVRVGR